MPKQNHSSIRIPRITICDQCGSYFETIDGQKTCVPCLIRPSRGLADSITNKKGSSMPQACKEKVCVDCNKPYQPTSNVQKRCLECMKKKSHHPGVRTKKLSGIKVETAAQAKKPLTVDTRPMPLARIAETLLDVSGGAPVEMVVAGIRITFAKA